MPLISCVCSALLEGVCILPLVRSQAAGPAGLWAWLTSLCLIRKMEVLAKARLCSARLNTNSRQSLHSCATALAYRDERPAVPCSSRAAKIMCEWVWLKPGFACMHAGDTMWELKSLCDRLCVSGQWQRVLTSWSRSVPSKQQDKRSVTTPWGSWR